LYPDYLESLRKTIADFVLHVCKPEEQLYTGCVNIISELWLAAIMSRMLGRAMIAGFVLPDILVYAVFLI